MKFKCLLLVATFCTFVTAVHAAEKNKTLVQCDITQSNIEAAAGKIEGNKEASADLERARTALKNADECYKAGKSFFGDINPETEKEMKLAVDSAEIATASALSRVEFVRAKTELEGIEKQHTAVSAKLKLFEDRKAELERLRLEATACQKTGKELEAVKAEKAALTSQVEQLSSERSRADKLKIEQLELTRKVEEMKAENSRLSALLEKQRIDEKDKAAKKP